MLNRETLADDKKNKFPWIFLRNILVKVSFPAFIVKIVPRINE